MEYKERIIALLNSTELTEEQKGKLEEAFPQLRESEEDRTRRGLMELLKELLYLGGVASETWDRVDCEKYLAWLERMGEKKVQYLMPKEKMGATLEQKPADWSEEDEKNINDISWYLNSLFDDTKINFDRLNDLEYWLKSLKRHSGWIPSEEQINALERECLSHYDYNLCRLLEDLKELKGE